MWPSGEIETPGCGGETRPHGGIAPQDPLRTGHRLPELGRGRHEVPRVDGDLQRVAAGAGEVAIDLLARLDGLGAVRLPAGAGERRLHPRGEDAETDGDQRPGDEDPSAMLRRQPAEAADRAEVVARLEIGARVRSGGLDLCGTATSYS